MRVTFHSPVKQSSAHRTPANSAAMPSWTFVRLVLLLILCLPSCQKADGPVEPTPRQNKVLTGDDATVIRTLVTAEETCLALSPKMQALSKGLVNLRLPGPGTESVFAPSVSVSDL